MLTYPIKYEVQGKYGVLWQTVFSFDSRKEAITIMKDCVLSEPFIKFRVKKYTKIVYTTLP